MNKQDQEWLYRDLEHTRSLYLGAEQIYPYWETIYALITGAFLTVYFTSPKLGFLLRLILCSVGLIYSRNWRRLVERNRAYANAREGRMRILSDILQKSVRLDPPLEVCPDDRLEPKTITGFSTFTIFQDQKDYLDRHATPWNQESTWTLRIFIPRFLLWIWALLVLYAIYGLCADFFTVPSWLQKLL